METTIQVFVAVLSQSTWKISFLLSQNLTPNPKPYILNPKPYILKPKPHILNPKL